MCSKQWLLVYHCYNTTTPNSTKNKTLDIKNVILCMPNIHRYVGLYLVWTVPQAFGRTQKPNTKRKGYICTNSKIDHLGKNKTKHSPNKEPWGTPLIQDTNNESEGIPQKHASDCSSLCFKLSVKMEWQTDRSKTWGFTSVRCLWAHTECMSVILEALESHSQAKFKTSHK